MSTVISMQSKQKIRKPLNLTDVYSEFELIRAFVKQPTLFFGVTDKVPLVPEDFSNPAYGALYGIIKDNVRQNKPVDVTLLANELRENLDDRTIKSLLEGELAELPVYIEHARRIRQLTLLRQFRAVAGRFLYSPSEENLREIYRSLAFCGSAEGGPVSIGESASLMLENMRNPVRGISYGFAGLDKWTNGMKPGEFIVVAARPSMGKSSLGTQIGVRAAALGKRTLFCSVEVDRLPLTQKALAALSGYSAQEIRQGAISEIDMLEWIKKMEQMPLWIDDRARQTASSIRASATSLKNQQGLDLVIVDYLGMVKAEGRYKNRNEEVTQICGDLKALARELNIPVIVLSQLNREVESRLDKRPMLSDLRDSGSVEQDADVVIFIYREKYYRPDADDTAELILAKQRHGPTGTVKVSFDPTTTTFRDTSIL